MEHRPVLYIVVPCYNEEAVLPLTAGMFTAKLEALAASGRIDGESRVLFVNDGSTDGTWDFIRALSAQDARVQGICLSRNRGHQNALLAGLFEAMERCDITISIDCDGQDDIDAMDRMVDEYLAGADIVYGTHPHTLQPIEEYKGKYIYYSMGNWSFGGNTAPRDRDTAIAQITVKREADGTVSLETPVLIPCKLSGHDAYNDYQPQPLDPESAEYARAMSKLDGSFTGPDLSIDYSAFH